jgi:hypothetical protein
MGGGIYVYEGLSKAAAMLADADAQTRHIILFSDACDSEQPGRYWELLDKAGKAGITVSVIGLGTDTDPDANLLRKIADAGNGRIFFTREPEELPRLFSQDTFVAAKSTFIDEPTAFKSTAALKRLFTEDYVAESEVGGYNICYKKPSADLLLHTLDENKSPILASWNFGLGRVVCYTGATSERYIGAFGKQKQMTEVFGAIFNWMMPDDRQTIENMPVTQKIVRGQWQATLHLDPEREREFFSENPLVTIMRSRPGAEPEQIVQQMQWLTADSLKVGLSLTADETIVAMVDAGKNRRLQLYPVCQNYSQEYRAVGTNEGLDKLRELAEITRGKESINLSTIWSTMPEKLQLKSLAEALLYLALLFFVIEVAERRTAVVSIISDRLLRRRKQLVDHDVVETKSSTASKSKIVSRFDAPGFMQNEQEPEPTNKEKEKNEGFLGALQNAKKRADKRIGKD